MNETKNQATEVAKVNGSFSLVADSNSMQQMISEDMVDLNIGLQRVKLPTGSLMAFTKYVQANMFKKRKLKNVITRITLKKATKITR